MASAGDVDVDGASVDGEVAVVVRIRHDKERPDRHYRKAGSRRP